MSEKKPTVLFVMGANGMGKTTTIGKVAGKPKYNPTIRYYTYIYGAELNSSLDAAA